MDYECKKILYRIFIIQIPQKNTQQKQKIYSLNIDFSQIKSFEGPSSLLSIISDKINEEITLRNFFIQTMHMGTWVNLFDLPSFFFFISNNLILDQETKIKITPKENQYSQFEDEELINKNQIEMQPIPSNRKLKCSICYQYSNDHLYLHKLGPVYGPFKYSKLKYYVHLLCALWLPKVCISPSNQLINVGKEINRSKREKCSYCQLPGAGLGCWIETCRKRYHYLCAKEDECNFNRKAYGILCKKHKKKYTIPDPEGCGDDLIEEGEKNLIRKIGENEEELLCCDICKMKFDQDKFVICGVCKKNFHEDCVGFSKQIKNNTILNEDIAIEKEQQEEEDYICENCKMDEVIDINENIKENIENKKEYNEELNNNTIQESHNE